MVNKTATAMESVIDGGGSAEHKFDQLKLPNILSLSGSERDILS
jgi:hypothetical protein